jgi:CelD/BcsL family acetyltransferase involved in cellulose biosynthesis
VAARVITTLAELDAEADRWGALDESAVSPPQRFSWIRACAASFGDELRFVVVDRDRELAAVAPLVAKGGVLELVGARDLYEPGDFAYRDADALASLAAELRQRKERFVIPRIAATSPTVSALGRAFRGRGALFVRPAGATPVVLLGRDPEEAFSSRRRSDVRRARRRAEELGEVAAEIALPTAAELPALLKGFYDVEAAGWKGEGGTALVNDPERRQFFDEYARAAAAEGTLRVASLRIGGEVAAMQLAVEQGRRLWLLKIGYDERFARCSPGTLLLLETLRWAAGAELEAVELLGRREGWTRVWTDEARDCVAVHAYPATARALGSLVSDAARQSKRLAVERSGRAYVAGPDLGAGLSAAREQSLPVAIGYWDAPGESAAHVEAMTLGALEGIAEAGLDGYVALKPAAFARVETVVARARELGVPIHLDSTGLAAADSSWELLARFAGPDVGCTLPTLWGRSLADAKRAMELGLRVRVVKGQWPDPDFRAKDEVARFLEIVDTVAAAPYLGVATHDRPLAEAAQARAPGATHERMLGLPWRGRDLPRTRIYVPFGHPYLPYAPGRARRSARVALWVARDVIRG